MAMVTGGWGGPGGGGDTNGVDKAGGYPRAAEEDSASPPGAASDAEPGDEERPGLQVDCVCVCIRGRDLYHSSVTLKDIIVNCLII